MTGQADHSARMLHMVGPIPCAFVPTVDKGVSDR